MHVNNNLIIAHLILPKTRLLTRSLNISSKIPPKKFLLFHYIPIYLCNCKIISHISENFNSHTDQTLPQIHSKPYKLSEITLS